VNLNRAYDSDKKVDAFMRQLQSRARELPGVTSAALVMNPPLTGASYTSDFMGYGRPAGEYGTEVFHSVVSPGYFTTMRVPVLRGREFRADDTPKTTPVIIINQTLAKTYFKGRDPLGQRLAFDKAPTPKSIWFTIVGIVGDEHTEALGKAPHIEAYESSTQNLYSYMRVVARTTGEAAALTGSVRSMLHDMDPTLALINVTTMDELRDASLGRTRFLTILMLMFGVIGLVLAVIGVYGVLAQVSRNRTREMGIRIALGAQAGQVRWLVVRKGLSLTTMGLLIGGVTASFTTRGLTKLLYGVAPNDPLTLSLVALILAATSIAAAWLPASRASRADPMEALRAD
jgi:putative ABC transport system permease protein